MTTYSSKNLTEYLGLVAAEKNISESELRKNISINDFGVSRSPSLFFGFLETERDFKGASRKYDAVVNIKRNIVPEFFGLEYKISATGVKFKKK